MSYHHSCSRNATDHIKELRPLILLLPCCPTERPATEQWVLSAVLRENSSLISHFWSKPQKSFGLPTTHYYPIDNTCQWCSQMALLQRSLQPQNVNSWSATLPKNWSIILLNQTTHLLSFRTSPVLRMKFFTCCPPLQGKHHLALMVSLAPCFVIQPQPSPPPSPSCLIDFCHLGRSRLTGNSQISHLYRKVVTPNLFQIIALYCCYHCHKFLNVLSTTGLYLISVTPFSQTLSLAPSLYPTPEALIAATTSWHQHRDEKQSVAAVFFDLSKAFDSVPHSGILRVLTRICVTGSLHTWFTDYLSGRTQHVVLNGHSSQVTKVSSCVPAKFNTSNIIILNLYWPVVLHPAVYHVQNPTLCWQHLHKPIGRDCTSDVTNLQRDIDSVTVWVKLSGLRLNTQKTKFLLVSRLRHPPPIELRVDGIIIFRVPSVIYLWVSISSDLFWAAPYVAKPNRSDCCIFCVKVRGV